MFQCTFVTSWLNQPLWLLVPQLQSLQYHSRVSSAVWQAHTEEDQQRNLHKTIMWVTMYCNPALSNMSQESQQMKS